MTTRHRSQPDPSTAPSAAADDPTPAPTRTRAHAAPAEVAEHARALFREATSLSAGLASAMGMHPSDVSALRALDLAGSHRPTMGELGEALGLSSAAVTGLVDRLEAHDLARRVPDPHDRRRVRVELTDHAHAVGAAVLAPVAERIARAVDRLGPGDRDVVVGFLRELLVEPPP